jgi:hypothetical protein
MHACINTLKDNWKTFIKLLHFRLSIDYSIAKGTQPSLMGRHKIGAWTELNVESYNARIDDYMGENDWGILKIFISPSSNHETKYSTFYKSEHIVVMLIKTLLTEICSFDQSQNSKDKTR